MVHEKTKKQKSISLLGCRRYITRECVNTLLSHAFEIDTNGSHYCDGKILLHTDREIHSRNNAKYEMVFQSSK